MKYFMYFLGIIGIFGTALPIIDTGTWWIRIFDFPRLQIHQGNPRPVIVAGDLNDVGWSETTNLFREYSQLADPREGRYFYNTYSVFLPLLRYPLDHVFYSNDFGLVEMVKLEAIGSDHYPILITLTFEPDASDLEEVENTDGEENEEVEEKIEEGNEEGN